METTGNKTTAALLQLSAYTQYFFPFGNFIFPVVIWSAKKDQSKFVDYNGKQCINFQLSILIYTIVLVIIAASIFLHTIFANTYITLWHNGRWVINRFRQEDITGLVVLGIVTTGMVVVLKVAEFFITLTAAIKNSNGEYYKYPLTINFIK